MNVYRKLTLILAILCGSIQICGFIFQSNTKDKDYYRDLLDNLEDKKRLSEYLSISTSLYGLLALCGENSLKLKYRNSKDMCYTGIQELDSIIENMKGAQKKAPNQENNVILLELRYLRNMAINQKFHEIKRF